MSTTDNDSDSNEDRRQKLLEEKFERERERQQQQRLAEEANKKEKEVPDAAVLKPTDMVEEQDKGLFFDKQKYPLYSQEEYNRYLSYQRGKRQQWIAEDYSKNTKFIIPLYVNNGGPDNDPLLDPDKPFTAQDADHIQSVGIEQKEFNFHDASVKYWRVLQDLDNEMTLSIQEIQNAIFNAPKGGVPTEDFKKLSDRLRNAEDKRYRYAARLFLRMTDDEYDRAVNLQNIKDAVDAAIHRTAYTVPNYTKTSTAGSSSIR